MYLLDNIASRPLINNLFHVITGISYTYPGFIPNCYSMVVPYNKVGICALLAYSLRILLSHSYAKMTNICIY